MPNVMISSAGCYANKNNSPNTVRSHPSAHAQFQPSSPISPHATSVLPLSPAPGATPGSPTTLALDMKRLLATPAPPYARPHGYSTGSGSESEGFSDSPQRKDPPVDRGAAPSKVARSRSLQSLLDHRKEREIDATAPEKDNKGKNKEKRPRNVLRRRPSTSSQLHHQKSSPALPTTTTMIATATAAAIQLPFLHSPLPPLSPRSPLTPSMFPPGSPASSTSFPLGSTSRPTTAPGSSPRSGAYPMRSALSFDKPLPPPPPPPNEDFQNVQDRPSGSGSGLAHAHNERWRNQVEGDVVEEYVVSVTDEKGKKVNPRTKLRELKGGSSPSLSPSKSHPPSPRLYHYPHQLSAPSSLNDPCSSRCRSRSRNPQPTDSEVNTNPSTSLTPAAAVVAAYKQQELLQETSTNVRSSLDVDVSPRSQGKKTKKRPHTSSGHGRSATDPRAHMSAPKSKIENDADDDGKHQPYYTVFGTSSDRVVAAGGPEDRHHLSWEIVQPPSLPCKGSAGTGAGASARGGGGGLRTLTRKVSGRFKRAGNGTQSEGEEREERMRASLSAERERERERGRPSLQEKSRTRGVLGRVEKGGLSLRLSIDKFAETKVVRASAEEKDTTPTSATKSRGSGASTPSPSGGGGGGGGGGGSKIWKLMKRISTGALREKFVYDEAPPVPSLPKEYAAPDLVRSYEVKTDAASTLPPTDGFGKAVRKKASVILGVKVTSNCGSPIIKPSLPSSPLATQVPVPLPAIRPSPPAPRPSTTTCSSSPVSSDVASSRFFATYKPSSMSAHSSTSSLPIEDSAYPPPPLPKSLFSRDSTVGQHIVPPSELGKMHVQSTGHGGSEDSLTLSSHNNPSILSPRAQMKLRVVVPTEPSSPVRTPREYEDSTTASTPEMVSLPLPPRRPGASLRRMRRDTYTTITAGAGEDHDGEDQDEAGDEDMKEWERIWARSSDSKDSDDVDERSLDSRSGSPMIPSFSTAEAINTFSSKRSSRASPSTTTGSPSINQRLPSYSYLDEMGYVHSPAGSLPPPPRPTRNPQRPASTPTQPSQFAAVFNSRYNGQC